MAQPHPHHWTAESIASFWDNNAKSKAGINNYFTNRWGAAIVRFVQFVRPLAGARILDYGCGPGFLSAILLEQGASVTAIEYSRDSAAAANRRFRDHPRWAGCHVLDGERPNPARFGSFDVVLCVETIEHPLEADLKNLFESVLALLKPGGVAVFTAPNAEDLDANMVVCPECGAEFHRWQHVRRWQPDQLREILSGEGFGVIFCEGISFKPFQPRGRPSLWDLSPRLMFEALLDLAARVTDSLVPRRFPEHRLLQRLLQRCWSYNLVAIACKPFPE